MEGEECTHISELKTGKHVRYYYYEVFSHIAALHSRREKAESSHLQRFRKKALPDKADIISPPILSFVLSNLALLSMNRSILATVAAHFVPPMSSPIIIARNCADMFQCGADCLWSQGQVFQCGVQIHSRPVVQANEGRHQHTTLEDEFFPVLRVSKPHQQPPNI